MGVATGITMEFQFGTNWAYYSHYVGDIFGVPLAIEGLMAFFLEGTFIGLFFFGWDRLSRRGASGGHLVGRHREQFVRAVDIDCRCVDAKSDRCAFQFHDDADGARFDPGRHFQPVAQSKFVHTVSAGYVTGAIFVLAISAWYLLKGRHVEFAKRSATVAISFGLAAALSVVVLGDESGYTVTEHQKMKLAAIESEWHTEPAPAAFTIFGLPDMENRETRAQIQVPWMLGLIATRSADTEVPGIFELVAHAKERIINGIPAATALRTLREDPDDAAARQTLKDHAEDLRLRACCFANMSTSVPSHRGADRSGCLGHRAVGRADFLVFPGDGRDRVSSSSACLRSGFTSPPGAGGAKPDLPEDRAVDSSVAVDRRRNGLVRGGAWTATLVHRGGIATFLAVSPIPCRASP